MNTAKPTLVNEPPLTIVCPRVFVEVCRWSKSTSKRTQVVFWHLLSSYCHHISSRDPADTWLLLPTIYNNRYRIRVRLRANNAVGDDTLVEAFLANYPETNVTDCETTRRLITQVSNSWGGFLNPQEIEAMAKAVSVWLGSFHV